MKLLRSSEMSSADPLDSSATALLIHTILTLRLKSTSKLIWSITVVHLSLDILDSNLICFFCKASELFYLRRSFNEGPLHAVCSILKQFLLERALKEITNIPTDDTHSHMA